MSAEIIEFFEACARRSGRDGMGAASAPRASTSASQSEFMFWAGAYGARYVHTVHSLVACPELPPCTYVLAYRSASGERDVLAVGQLTGAIASLNLAELRHRGARLGANEIHVHLLPASRSDRTLIVLDIKGALAGRETGGKVASAR